MSMLDNFKKIKNQFFDMLFPGGIKCIFCGDELKSDSHNQTCPKCYKKLPFIYRACPRCGSPTSANNTAVCKNCKNNNFHFKQATSPFVYVEPISQIVHKIKFTNKSYPISALTRFMLECYATKAWKIDYVTYVPIHATRKRERGFDQSKILAEEFCKVLNLPLLDLCTKVKNNLPQAQLTFSYRHANVLGAYEFNKEHQKTIKNKNILIIDDIMTTGATANAVSEVVMKAGAKACYILTLAHTELQ